MNATQSALRAYAPNGAPTRSARAVEIELFSRITARLAAASDSHSPDRSPAARFRALAEALYENRQLWNLLATDVADAENGLPPTLRARIFYLAEFTVAHSRRVLSGEATAEPLIEINRAIISGLAGAKVAS